MRKIAGVLLGCLLVAGCAQQWEADLRFKVAQIEDYQIAPSEPKTKRAIVELVDKLPEDVITPFERFSRTIDHFPAGIAVGDQLICHVTQSTPAGIQTNPVGQGEISNCRTA